MKKEVIALVAPPWWLIPSKNIITATEHLVEDYSYNLTKSGFKNIIFSRAKDNTDLFDTEDVNGYSNKYYYTALTMLDRKLLKMLFGKRYNGSLFFYWFYIIRIAIKIRKLKISYAVVFQTFTFCFWIKLFNPKLKLMYHIGNHELSKKDMYYNYDVISDKIAKLVLPKIDSVVTVSDFIRHGIIERFPNLKNKCCYIYPGIDLNVFKPKWEHEHSDDKVIIYAGRVVPEKGLHVLVEAMKLLKKDFPDVRLLIYGSDIGPNVQDNYLDNLKDGFVEMRGLYPRKEIADILRSAMIFVYPVVWEEALGLAPLEAMAAGVPVVVSDVKSGYSEIINQQNGFYFKSGDSFDLKKIIKTILEDSKKQYDIGQKARETIKIKLSWEQCIRKTIKYLMGEVYD